MKNRSKWCLLGIPDHEAVLPIGGRLGAACGPNAFRQEFFRLSGRDSVHSRLRDEGDVGPISADVAANHRRASERIARVHGDSAFSVIVGGSHDHGFSHLQGIARSMKKPRLGCINLDAHLDVRRPDPEITSGSPFYLALEEGVIHPGDLVEFGIQRHCNAAPLWDYVEKKRVPVVPFEKLRGGKAVAAFSKALKRLARSCEAIAISLDLDAIEAAHAPGVSAPQPEGFTPSEILAMLEMAAAHRQVVSLGIFELNPEHDVDRRTARLAAIAAYSFSAIKLKNMK